MQERAGGLSKSMDPKQRVTYPVRMFHTASAPSALATTTLLIYVAGCTSLVAVKPGANSIVAYGVVGTAGGAPGFEADLTYGGMSHTYMRRPEWERARRVVPKMVRFVSVSTGASASSSSESMSESMSESESESDSSGAPAMTMRPTSSPLT